MPELPEVQTTVDGLNARTKGRVITDAWTDYRSPSHAGKDNIKNPKFFARFRDAVIGAKIKGARRRAKNILIDLDNGETILIHMKMTGHVMHGRYSFDKNSKTDPWKAADPDPENPLNDPFNRFIHLAFTLCKTSGKDANPTRLVLSDMRKFGKVTIIPTDETAYGKESHPELSHLGPEPLDQKFTFAIFDARLSKRQNAPIKQALMDQTLIAGIGNIYSDEIFWKAGIHPKSQYKNIPGPIRKDMFKATKEMLLKGIDFGGDSMSDYRNIDGLPGEFQGQHKAYRRTGKECGMRAALSGKRVICKGTIERLVIGGRSAHFCNRHQIIFPS